MVYWETGPDEPDYLGDFTRIWRAAEKIVYSRTLETVASASTRIERDFDPAAVRALKESSARDITVGGPHLAAQALEAGLVDELQVFVAPALVGSGNAAFPARQFADLELREERHFAGGFVFLRYRVS
jgi:dihydrofolate reductase